MGKRIYERFDRYTAGALRRVAVMLSLVVSCTFNIFSMTQEPDRAIVVKTDSISTTPEPQTQDLSVFPDSMWISSPRNERVEVVGDSIAVEGDSIAVSVVGAVPVDTVNVLDPLTGEEFDPDYVVREFNPDPTRAVWMAALFPGLGQLYNRRYWKLPLVIGGFMGLGYATNWNNRMLEDYTQAYRDLMDNDPSTKSYMDFYPPNTKEESLNKTWMEKTFKTRKDFYRRNRDLCVIGMVALYLVAMVDAYVDASLAHFDITPDLSVDVHPTVIKDTHSALPGLGFQWAFNF